MWFLYDNIATFAVFSVCATFAWLFGGIRADYLVPVVPWLTAILVEVLVCFPQRHSGETTYEARERVWDGVRHDPLTWVSLGFLALLLIPFVNVGLCPICDYPEIAAGADPSPTVPFLPFCVNRLQHLNVFLWFLPTLFAVVTVRHALLKRGKRLALVLVVWNGLLLGVIGAAQQMTSAVGPLWSEASAQTAYFFSTFGYPNMAGDYFTTLFGLSVGLWRWRVNEVDRADAAHVEKVRHVRFWKKHYFLIPAVIFFFCALDTLSRAAIILVTVLAVLFFLHAFLCFFSKMKKANRVRISAISAFVLSAIALCAVVFMPEDIQKEIDTLGTTEVLDRVTGKGQYHVRVATQIWKENFFFGVGGWGYKHFCIPAMTEKELAQQQQVGGINVHNDYLQLLAEHGTVGFALLVAVVVLLLWPLGRVWKAMLESVRFLPNKEQPPQPVQIFVLPAPVFCILATAIATFVHGFGDCPLRSPAVLSLFFVSLACMDGFLPYVRRS